MSRAGSEFAVGLADQFYQFGESLVYSPGGGGASRTITGIVAPDNRETEEGAVAERDVERVWVTVRRDASHATDGGIDAPATHDRLFQNSESEPEPFVYQEQIRNQTADAWDLLYSRNVVKRQGPPHAA
jgi:hypothetical protein